MTPAHAARILEELTRRARSSGSALASSAFDVQRAFIEDTSRMKAALCTRRSGKSYGIGLYLMQEAAKAPGVSCLYVALTRESAKRIMHKDVLKVINRKFDMGASFNETTLTVSLQNGSTIYLLGADAKPDEADKILGQKFALAVVDESASFRQDLKHLVYAIIKPTLIDLQGTLALIGTPGNAKNFFYDVTTGQVPGWALHKWSAHENPHVASQWQTEIDELLRNNPLILESPAYRQMYQGEWTVDETKLVYRYDGERNDLEWSEWEAIREAKDEWRYVLGIDLGYSDDTALVVTAYREHDPTLYIVEAEKRPKLIVSQVGTWVRSVMARYEFHTLVVDNAAKQSVEELRQRYGLPLEAAEKAGKADAIAMMNSDLITQRIRVLRSRCAPLVDEWQSLVWDDRAPRPTELASCANHCADAALYAWRNAMNFAAVPKTPMVNPHGEAAVEAFWEGESDRIQSESRKPFWER